MTINEASGYSVIVGTASSTSPPKKNELMIKFFTPREVFVYAVLLQHTVAHESISSNVAMGCIRIRRARPRYVTDRYQ